MYIHLTCCGTNGNIVFRDQECRIFKEKGRKVDCSDWDFEEPQVRIVKYAVGEKEIMVVLSLLYRKKKAFKSEFD